MLNIIEENKFYLIFGGALTSIALTLDRHLRNQAKKNQKIKQDIKEWRKNGETWPYYDKLSKDPSKKAYVAIDHVIPNVRSDTLLIRAREMPLHVGRPEWFNHVSGGSFTFVHRSKEIVAELNDVKILSNVLSETNEDVRIFGHMNPVVKKVAYYLRNGQSLAVVGVLSFDIASKKFKLEPMVMGFSLQSIIDFYEDMYFAATIPRFATFIMAGFGIWLLYKPVKKLINHIISKLPWRRAAQTDQQRENNLMQYIKSKGEIKTSEEHVFECIKCKKNPTCIIYKCGHLSLCETCHEQNKEANKGSLICPVCHQKSKSDIKIFFA